MKKIDLGQTIQIVANVGVIAGLVLLAYEISQNTLQLQRSSMDATQQQAASWRQAITQNADLARIWVEGLNGADSLSPADRARARWEQEKGQFDMAFQIAVDDAT